MHWLDLLAAQGTLKSLLQHHSSKAPILWGSAFFVVQSHSYMTTGKAIALTRQIFAGKIMSLLLWGVNSKLKRIDAFELWCWRRLLRVPWAARRSNQSILKEISPEYSLEGLMLKLKLQHFGHLM